MTAAFRLAFTVSLFLRLYAAQSQSICEQSSHVLEVINQHHINPRVVDSRFIADLNDEFYNALDPLGLYFCLEDLKSDSVLISASLLEKNSSCQWMKSVKTLYRMKLREAEKKINSILAKPFSFNEDDFISMKSFRQEEFCKNKTELTKRWKRWLTLELLASMYEKASEAEKIDAKEMMTHEAAARAEIKAKELKKISDILNDTEGIDNELQETFLKSITKVFDPHSDFFSSTEMKSFEENISTTESSFGFDIREENDEVLVSRVIPGSPAWKSNEVHKGDVLLQIKKPKGDFVNIEDFNERPSHLLKAWDEDQIEFKIKKADGQIVVVKLAKEKMESTENRVQGFVLSGVKKIGYVALPSFYREWDGESDGNGGCADDLAKEIIKLKKEGIAGLILDLRYNGGGSVGEAIDIVGIFIDIGPVSLLRLKEQTYTLKDSNRGAVYDGPLLVMVNGASASASEFVAAALQDYNRALIVGNTTYGKGTGQRIFSSDSIKKEFLKITDEKLYRITGKTNQRKGVTPDVNIPDLTDEFVAKEKQAKHVLVEDSIVKKVYYTPSPKVNLTNIKASSRNRIKQSPQFDRLDSIRIFYRQPIPLKLNSFIKYHEQTEHVNDLMGSFTPTSKFKVAHNQFDNSLLKMDSFRKALSDESLVKISRSIFIDEAYSIIIDYINQIKK